NLHYVHIALVSFPTRRSSELQRPVFDIERGDIAPGEHLVAIGVQISWIDPQAPHLMMAAGAPDLLGFKDFRAGALELLDSKEIPDRKSTRLNSSHEITSYDVF